MASLYIKDEETAALAAEVARRLGTTKTEAVRTALREKQSTFAPEMPGPAPDIVAWLRERRRTHPLPPDNGTADKAFFDEMWARVPIDPVCRRVRASRDDRGRSRG